MLVLALCLVSKQRTALFAYSLQTSAIHYLHNSHTTVFVLAIVEAPENFRIAPMLKFLCLK